MKAFLVFYTPIVLNIAVLCLSEQLALKGNDKTEQCENAALSEVDASMCMSIDAPEVTAIAVKVVDCRLSVLGKPPLQCSYLPRKAHFKCNYPLTDGIANEVLAILLDIFDRCHTSRLEYFQSEVASLLGELTTSARMTEDMHVKLLESKFPLKLLRRIREIQQDGVAIEMMILNKAEKLTKKASDITDSLSYFGISSKTNDGQWKTYPFTENCFSEKDPGEEASNEVSVCISQFGLCITAKLLDWVFSLTCTSLFLLMIHRMEANRERPLSLLIGTLLFALRAYSSSQNYTTFLEQFFLETLTGYFLLSVMLWLSSVYDVRL